MPASPSMNMSMSTSLTSPGASMLAAGGAGGSVQYALESAGRQLERHLQADSQLPGLAERLRVVPWAGASVSGLHESDYPSLAAVGQAGMRLQSPHGPQQQQPLVSTRHLPLPAQLTRHLNQLQCSCLMGAFPQLQRAWLTIDNDIYLWQLETGGDVAYYDGLSEAILAVALVSPRPGVFQPHIKHLLCLATPLELVILGVTLSGGSQLHLLPEPIFSVASDGAYVTCIVGTPTGRIFMGAHDGCLYELVYQATDGWFSSRCRKVNHSRGMLSLLVPSFVSAALSQEDPLVQLIVDESRQMLYTRSQKSSIQLYYLGKDGSQLERVAALSLYSIVQAAGGAARTVDQNNFRPLIDLSCVPSSESSEIHLIATTGQGVRLYFTTTLPLGGASGSPVTSPCAPSCLQLVHVRLPPGFAANAPAHRPAGLHLARCLSGGTALLLATQTDDADALWLLSGDALPGRGQLAELQYTLPLRMRAWAVCELPDELSAVAPGSALAQPPLVVNQHARRPRRFLVVSAQGLQVLELLRPVDQLRALLEEAAGPDSDPLRAYFGLHGEQQAGAACLILACSDAPQDSVVAERASRALLQYGGAAAGGDLQPQRAIQAAGGFGSPYGTATPTRPADRSLVHLTSFHPQQVSTPRADSNLFGHPQHALSPATMPQSPLLTGGGLTAAEMQQARGPFSARHESLYLYTSRLLRPIWCGRLFAAADSSTTPRLVSTCSAEQLGWLTGRLSALERFLQRHTPLTSAPTGAGFNHAMSTQQLQRRMDSFLQPDSSFTGAVVDAHMQPAQLTERQSLSNLLQFIGYVKQVIGLMKVVVDHQSHVVAAALSESARVALCRLTYGELAVSGRDACHQLIGALVGRYLDDRASTEAIAARLRDVCPTLFRPEDAVSARASELIAAARDSPVDRPDARRKLLDEALQLTKQVAGQLQLAAVCQHFQSVQYYEGVLELSLAAAEKRDPQGVAVHYYKSGEPLDDTQGRQAYNIRSECYGCVLDMLSGLVTRAASSPKHQGGSSPAAEPQLARRQTDLVLQVALRSDDQLLHVHLYGWMLTNGMSDKLLQVDSPYLEEFLRRSAGSDPRPQTLELLWKHYERVSNYVAAARILSKLAERHGTDVDLKQRIEFLARAILCVKSSDSHASAAAQGEFLHELEEKLEVARIQSRILEAVRGGGCPGDATAPLVARLNSDLLDVTALYQLCETHALWRYKLAIVCCAGHRDPALVAALWNGLLETELAAIDGSSNADGASCDWAAARAAVAQLARQYRQQPAYFPLETIAGALETYSSRCAAGRGVATPHPQPGWVVAALTDADVPIQQLLTVYQALYRQNDPVWTRDRRPLHLAEVICCIVDAFADCPSMVPARERMAFKSVCLDAVSACLIDLNASCEPTAPALVSQFRAVQAVLRRIIS